MKPEERIREALANGNSDQNLAGQTETRRIRTMTFCNPTAQAILPGDSPEVENACGNLLLTSDGTLWNRVTPELLAWMESAIESRFEQGIDNDKPLSQAITYYHALLDASGLQPSGQPAEPVKQGMDDEQRRALSGAICESVNEISEGL